MNHGRIRTLVTKLARSMIGHGSSTTTMLPTDVAHWLKLLEDVVNSPAIQALSVLLRHECFLHEEFEHISMDATIRILRRTCGQADYRAKAEVRQAAVITDEEAKRRVLTIMGRTSAVLAMSVVKDEASCNIVAAISKVDRHAHIVVIRVHTC